MSAFEKHLLNEIPQDEASSYFLRITGRDKLASANLEEAWNELSTEEQDAVLKEAMDAGLLEEKEANAMMGGAGGGGAKMGPPPAPASMPAATPQALPPTAQGMNSVKSAAERLKASATSMKIAFDGGDNTMSAPSGTGPGQDADGDPTLEEYLRQESMGQQAEEVAGASFYRERLQKAMMELEQVKAQADETSAKTQELEQQVSMNDEAIQASMQQAQMAQQSAMANVQQAHEMTMQATNQAMESQAEVLRQKQLAAAMRMGVQTLKDNVMNAMAQDPTDQLAQQLQAPPPGSAGVVGGQPPPPPPQIDPMTGLPMAPMPADPNAAAAGGAPAPAGGEGGGEKKPSSSSSEGGEKKEKSESKSEKKDSDKKDDDGGKTHVEVKTGSDDAEARFLAAIQEM